MPNAYPLESLLRVRRLRESEAERSASRAEDALRAAREALAEKRSAFEAWLAWRSQEVERRYAAFLGKTTRIDGVTAFNSGIASLYAAELARRAEIEEAERACEEAQAKRDAARIAAKQARKNAAKIEIHRSIWLEEEKKAREREEDKAFEEFHSSANALDAS